jgi:hypothetical protein
MPNKLTLKQFEKDELTNQLIFTAKSERRMLVEHKFNIIRMIYITEKRTE